MKDLEMIISYEDLERNRKRILRADKKRATAAKKEKIRNILGVALFYTFIVVSIILINARMEQINKNTTAVETNAVVMNESVN